MTLYSQNEWKQFRDEVIELDGYKCRECGRTNKEVTLQVHHRRYEKGKLPWEYPLKECETLCKGCHAARHGITVPHIGWEFIGQEDLGDLTGTCEKCGASIRHCFLIQHENWGTLEVGTFCCDKLTDTKLASNLLESQVSYVSRKKRYINSKRWRAESNIHTIKQSSFEIEIKEMEDHFLMKIHSLESAFKYSNLIEAKSKSFDVIDSGALLEYLDSHSIPYRKKKLKKVKEELP